MSEDTLTAELLPEPALRQWLGDRLAGEGRFRVERITSGLSNELFVISRAGHEWVVRRPPRVGVAPGAHDVVREYRVLRALEDSAVPHPRPFIVCADPEVIGVPFYVMARVEGVSLRSRIPAELQGEPHRAEIAHAMVDALAALHLFDWESAGLDGLGRPADYTARQVDRWMGQLERYRSRPLPALDQAAAWLKRQIPKQRRTSLIHCDFGLHNVLFEPDPPARLAAVFDWETATLGDPLADIGHFLGCWITKDRDHWFGSRPEVDLSNFPDADDMAARYGERTGTDLGELRWYRALGQLRIAVILEGSYAKVLGGGSDNPAHKTLAARVPNVAERALAICLGEA